MKVIIGKVIKGAQRGRVIGFPTANIVLKEEMQSGVYAGAVILDSGNYMTAIFIPDSRDLLEIHVLNFNGNLYDKEIEVCVGEKIRDVKNFDNEKELVKQIKKDIEKITSNYNL